MAQNTHIEWADATLNALAGCRKISPECDGCYAIKDAWRLAHNPNEKVSRKFLPVVSNERGINWTGDVTFTESALFEALKTKKPTRYFVNSLSDLFYEGVTDEMIDKHFAVFALCPQHTFMVLTKRPERMKEYIETLQNYNGVIGDFWIADSLENGVGESIPAAYSTRMDSLLPNVWLGVSVGNQKYADERRESLRDTPASVKFVSYEPALGPIDWKGWEFVDQIISGGESGPKARPSHPDWHRATRDFCQANGIAYFFKQWGAWMPCSQATTDEQKLFIGASMLRPKTYSNPFFHTFDGLTHEVRIGKKKAGRELDGRTWDEFPKLAVFA